MDCPLFILFDTLKGIKMKKFPSIKSNNDFRKVYNKGKSIGNKYLVMYILENHIDSNRIGISVSKKVGNSIVRHNRTRLLREIFRLNEIKKSYDIVLVVRMNAKDIDYKTMEKSYLHLIKLHKINL